MRKSTWNTYRVTCYTHDVANNQSSAGGVHKHQVRRTATGWQYRIAQSNGVVTHYGPVSAISDAEGEAKYAAGVPTA